MTSRSNTSRGGRHKTRLPTTEHDLLAWLIVVVFTLALLAVVVAYIGAA